MRRNRTERQRSPKQARHAGQRPAQRNSPRQARLLKIRAVPRGALALRSLMASVWMSGRAFNSDSLAKGATMTVMKKLATVAMLFVVNIPLASGGEHHTLRFLYGNSGSAKRASALAISPDGKEFALCVESGTVHFIRTADGEQISQITAQPFVMKYSKDGSCVLMVTTDESFVVETQTRRRASVDTGEEPGYIGLRTVQRNGKLLVEKLIDGGPAANSGQLLIGDEIIGFALGKSAEIQSAIGLNTADFVDRMKGPVRTFVRIQVLRKGQQQPEIVLLQRAAAKKSGETIAFVTSELPVVADNLVLFQRDGRHTFVSAYDGTAIGSLMPEDLEHRGQHAVSPNHHHFATLAVTKRDRRKYGIEVFDLTKLERMLTLPFERSSFVALTFSAQGDELLAGSRDRIDAFEVSTGKFQRSYRLDGTITTTFDDDRPKKNPVKFDGSIGQSVAAAAADRNGYSFEAPPYLVHSIAASPRLLAVAAPWGQVDLLDFVTGVSVRTFPFSSDGQKVYEDCKVEVMEFSADGRWLIFYVNGVLNIVDVSDLKPKAPRD